MAVTFEPHAVDITVTNPTANGSLPGSHGASAPAGGHGIVGMRERATLLGGTLQAQAEHGLFRLHARLPHTQTTP